MHLGRAISLCSVIPLFVSPCMSLPVDDHRPARSQGLAPRATYSVVPIDGGSGPGGSGSSGDSGGSGSGSGSDSGSGPGPGNSPTGPVTVTVVKTSPPKTSFHTIYVTAPPVTQRVTNTVVITKTIEVVHISPDATASSATAPHVSASQANSATQTPSIPSLSTPETPTSTRSSTSMTSGIPLQTGFSSTLTTTAHNDGKWHTSYPSWNGTMLRRGSRDWLRPRRVV